VIEVDPLSPVHAQLILAMLAQMALAVVLLLVLPIPRSMALRARKVTLDNHGRPIFPKWATQVADCFSNQFQVPVLFYVLCLLILFLRFESDSLVWFAWGFVALRWMHAAVFVTSNFVPLRFGFFLLSGVAFLAMLLQVVLHIVGF
jgi:hypothetical protein